MGAEGAGVWLGVPLLVLLVGALSLLIWLASRPAEPSSEPGASGSRYTARGYLASLVATVPASLWLARSDLRLALPYALGLCFVLLLLITALMLPAIAILRRVRKLSVMSVTLFGALSGALIGATLGTAFLSISALGALFAAMFGFGTSLPLVGHGAMPANKSLERSRDR
jgi:hypothetical protein